MTNVSTVPMLGYSAREGPRLPAEERQVEEVPSVVSLLAVSCAPSARQEEQDRWVRRRVAVVAGAEQVVQELQAVQTVRYGVKPLPTSLSLHTGCQSGAYSPPGVYLAFTAISSAISLTNTSDKGRSHCGRDIGTYC